MPDEPCRRSPPALSLRFVPRQVVLFSRSGFDKVGMAIGPVSEGMTEDLEKMIRKEEKKKKRKEKNKGLIMSGPVGEVRAVVLRSISDYLERNGFLKALSVFRSEVQVEIEDWSSLSLKLEDLVSDYLDSSNRPAKVIIDQAMEQDMAMEQGNVSDVVENIHKEKRKKGKETDGKKDSKKAVVSDFSPDHLESDGKITKDSLDGIEINLNEEKRNGGVVEKLHVGIEGKKKQMKIICDSHIEKDENDEVKVTVSAVGDAVSEKNELKPDVAKKEKRKKGKKNLNECAGNDDGGQDLLVMTEETEELGTLPNSTFLPCEADKEHDGEKKKKKSVRFDSSVSSMENQTVEGSQNIEEDKKASKSKDKKKRKNKPNSEAFPVDVPCHKGQDDGQKENVMDGKSQDGAELNSVEAENGFELSKKAEVVETKERKKRKMKHTEERGHTDEVPVIEECENTNENQQISKVESGKGLQTSDMKCKVENTGASVSNKDIVTSQDTRDNGKIEKNEANALSKNKKGKNSTEAKPIKAFQRVKVDDIKFADERLQDNSYWAKDGAGIGYGAKAQEVLGQVKGRDFKHEKTKKKRGTYRGGAIDLQSHSIKFNYSDEE